jgi:benzoyl-CoA reductase/2-hydroxyglutaryl-CoA dehydratase subunit BcrC/BadD/HgdB
MKKIAYTCPYVPAEWIAAHGLKPSRIMVSSLKTTFPLGCVEGVCPFIQAFAHRILTDDSIGGVVMTTLCDQTRRAYDVISQKLNSNVFLMNVPSTWKSNESRNMYINELKRLGRFLCKIGGNSPSKDKLLTKIIEYDGLRKNLLDLKKTISTRQFSESISHFNENVEVKSHKDLVNRKSQRENIPLALVGGPLCREDLQIFDMVENAKGIIAIDASETGVRTLPRPFKSSQLRKEPLVELENAYFSTIPDASNRPNDRLYDWLKNQIFQTKVRGIILRHMIFCDIWHSELYRLRKVFDLPVLDLHEDGQIHQSKQRLINRIQAFMEMLK